MISQHERNVASTRARVTSDNSGADIFVQKDSPEIIVNFMLGRDIVSSAVLAITHTSNENICIGASQGKKKGSLPPEKSAFRRNAPKRCFLLGQVRAADMVLV